jgi:hypothetical protein
MTEHTAMWRLALVLALMAGLWPSSARAQQSALPSDTPAPKTTPVPQLLGASFTAVPEVLYAQVPALPKGKGLLIEAIAKDSVAAKIGLHRFDVVVSYGNASVQDVKQLAGLLWATPPGQKATFVILRAGKQLPINYVLKAADLPTTAMVKPTGPPAVNLEVAPLSNDRMKITFTYYAGDSSKLQTFVCEGTLVEIEKQLKSQKPQIPGPVQELLDVAVDRIRMMKMR